MANCFPKNSIFDPQFLATDEGRAMALVRKEIKNVSYLPHVLLILSLPVNLQWLELFLLRAHLKKKR